MTQLTFGSLFAGIGGFDLGFERSGMTCKWQVEIDDYANRVLAKHWPNVHRERDIRECGAHNLERVDVICGGFPCQPHSLAGPQLGENDERNLWPEYLRIIREIKPRWIVGENVPGILSTDVGRFFGGVLRDLAGVGYDAEWTCISAADVGAPHGRDRLWLVAYPNHESQPASAKHDEARGLPENVVALHAKRRQREVGLHLVRARWIQESVSLDRVWPDENSPLGM